MTIYKSLRPKLYLPKDFKAIVWLSEALPLMFCWVGKALVKLSYLNQIAKHWLPGPPPPPTTYSTLELYPLYAYIWKQGEGTTLLKCR